MIKIFNNIIKSEKTKNQTNQKGLKFSKKLLIYLTF